MKKIILVILALTLLVISCKKKDDEITGPGSNSGPAAITPQPDKAGTFEYQVKSKTFVNGTYPDGHKTEGEVVFDAQGILKYPKWYDPKTYYGLIYKCIFSDSTTAIYYGQLKVKEDGIEYTFEFFEGFKIIKNGTELNMTDTKEGEVGTLGKDDIDWSYVATYELKTN